MKCSTLRLPDGGVAIVCTSVRRRKCQERVTGPYGSHRCAEYSAFQCDWKIEGGTCDRHLCQAHATQVASDKHLCPDHVKAYADWRAARGLE